MIYSTCQPAAVYILHSCMHTSIKLHLQLSLFASKPTFLRESRDQNICCRELLQAMASQAMQRLQQFNSQNISNTLWAFASLNHHPGPMLLKVLQRELVHKLRQFTPQGIENVLWAFATLGHHPGHPQASHSQFCTRGIGSWAAFAKSHTCVSPPDSFASEELRVQFHPLISVVLLCVSMHVPYLCFDLCLQTSWVAAGCVHPA